jgi:3D (Asp-Asp-Asp) domain-containing protein
LKDRTTQTFLGRLAVAMAMVCLFFFVAYSRGYAAAPPRQDAPNCKVFLVTAYTHTGNRTATGLSTYGNEGRIVAVDPRVIPLGTSVFIHLYGWVQAQDTGGQVLGYRLDLLLPTYREAIIWGVQPRTVCW